MSSEQLTAGMALETDLCNCVLANPLDRCTDMVMKAPGKQVKPQLLLLSDSCPAILNTPISIRMVKSIPSDIMIMGNAIPDFIFGWSNRLSYNNLS